MKQTTTKETAQDNTWLIFVAPDTRVSVTPRNGKPRLLECKGKPEPFEEKDEEVRKAAVLSGACRYADEADFKKGGKE